MKKLIPLFFLVFLASILTANASTQYPNGTGIFNSNATYSLNETSGTEVFDSAYNLGGHLVGTLSNQWIINNHTNFSSNLRIAETDVAFISGWGTVAGRAQHMMCDNLTINGWYNRNGTTPSAFFGVEGAGGTPAIQLHISTGKFKGVYNAVVGSNEQTWGDIANLMPSTYDWYMITLVRNGTCSTGAEALDLYINGVRQTGRNITATNTMTDVALSVNLTFGASRTNAGVLSLVSKELLIDDITIWNRRRLTDTEILEMYQGNYTTFVPPEAPPSTFNLSNLQPDNNEQFNSATVHFNVTVNSSTIFNISLLLNGTIVKTQTDVAPGNNLFINFTYDFSTAIQSQYNWSIGGYNLVNGSNSTNRTLYVDRGFPSIITSFPNMFTVFANNFTRQFNFTDQFSIFSINFRLDGNITANVSGINAQNYSYMFTLNVSNISVGVHTLNVSVSDGHTAAEIPNFDYSTNFLTNKLTYNFVDDYISIQPLDSGLFDTFETEKNTDRYSFIYNRGDGERLTETFSVKSSHQIYIINDNRIDGWLVIPGLNKWVDFEQGNSYNSYSIKRISDTEVEVTFVGLKGSQIIFNSIGELNTYSQAYSFYVGNVTTSLTTPVTETDVTLFTAVFTKNVSFISDINASLIWNGTSYGFDTKVNGSTQINFTKLLSIPQVSATQAVNVYWNYTIFGVNNTEQNDTFPQQQTIIDLAFSVCNDTNSTANVTLTLIPYSEESLINLPNVSVKATFQFIINSTVNSSALIPFNRTFDFDSNSGGNGLNTYNYSICVNPFNQSYKADAFIDYSLNQYTQRNYFLVQYPLGIEKRTVNLYLVNSSLATDVTITAIDENNNALENNYIKVLRYYPAENLYRTVEITKTGTDGKGITRLILNNIWYKFLVDDTNRTVFVSQQQKVGTTTLFLQAKLEDSFIDTINKVDNLESSFVFNNATGTFVFVWNDLNNVVQKGCLLVQNMTGYPYTVCNDCLTASAGSLSCAVNTTIRANYIATAYIDTNTQFSNIPKWNIYVNLFPEFKNFGFTGLFLQLLLLGIMAGIGLWNPTVALVYGAVTLIVGLSLGIVGLPYAAASALIILIVVMVGLMK